MLAAAAIGLGFLIPYTLYLNHQVGVRFGQLQWQLPTRVYARPLTLAPGLAMDAQTLKTELDAASYRDDGAGARPGTYARNGGRWLIASRGFNDVTGPVGPSRIQVQVGDGRVREVRDMVGKRDVRAARLDPARIATLYGQKQEERRLVRIEEVPELLVTGLQAVEDKDFAHHHGIDVSGMLRARGVTVRSRGESMQGGSTLTQQLARSGLLGIGREQTLTRKFNENPVRAADRGALRQAHHPRDLPQPGLPRPARRAGNPRVAAASDHWFGRDLRDLDTAQIALLIGMVRGPSYYDARRNPERALERRDFVLGKMHESKLIGDEEYARALKAPLGVTDAPGSTAANRFRPTSTSCAGSSRTTTRPTRCRARG